MISPSFPNNNNNNHHFLVLLQDIYELKDQIEDVEGRYMQGLKELKVEGLVGMPSLCSLLPSQSLH